MHREDKKLTEVVEIIDSKAERARLVQRTDVLDKVKALATLPGHGEATTAQVAEFYEVKPATITNVVHDHRPELEDNGYRVLTGQSLAAFRAGSPDLRQLETESNGLTLSRARSEESS